MNYINWFVFSSIIVIISGFLLIWFGLIQAETETNQTILPIPVKDSTSAKQKQASLITPPPAGLQNDQVFSGLEGEVAYVTKVVDGDTVDVVIDGTKHTIRLLGVDTPETVDPRKSVQCFGKESSNKTKELLSGKEVILQKDVTETDKYKRILRFIYIPLEDGDYLFVNDYLIREGYGKVLTIPPDVKYAEQFLDAQRQARENKKGLWGKC